MNLRIQLQTNATDVAGQIARIARSLVAATLDELRKLGAESSREIAERLSDDKHVRSGNLARSIRHRVERREGGDLVLDVYVEDGPARKYAQMQEEGGTITPREKEFLAVPTREALTQRGLLKGKYQGLRTLREAALVFIRPRGGTPFLAEVRGKGMKLVPVFWLVKSVEITGIGYMRTEYDQLASVIGPRLTGRLNRVLRGEAAA